MTARVQSTREGIAIVWDGETDAARSEFRSECILSGLVIANESQQRVVVDRYRNEFETLELVTEALGAIGVTMTLDKRFATAQRENDDEVREIERIRSSHPPEPVSHHVPGFLPERRLFDYQAEAVARHQLVRNAADFSVPGSGKTTTALATWAHAKVQEPQLGIWVIGPLSCFSPWEEEFEQCFGRPPNALRLWGSGTERARLAAESHRYELVLMSYHSAWRSEELVRTALQKRPRMLVLDEAHYIKNPHGVLAGAVRRLSSCAHRRMILTGTPMPRDPTDVWSQFTFLWPSEGLLGNYAQHELRCRQPPARVVEELREHLGPFFHRTCKADMGLPLPVVSYPVITPEDVPASQRLIIRLLERRTLQENEHLSPRDRRHLARWRRARLIRLMQAASNPLLLASTLTPAELEVGEGVDVIDEESLDIRDPDGGLARAIGRFASSDETAAKIAHVVARCRQLVEDGEKVVIWTVFLGNVECLCEMLSDLNPLAITGAVPLYDDAEDESAERSREARVTVFKSDPSFPVLVASMGACSEAISLHKAAQHALYLERNFNAGQFVQSLDRIHRQGMPSGKTAHFELPSIPCSVERVLNRRLLLRQQHLFDLLEDPMPVVGFDSDAHRGYFDVEDYDDLDSLFVEVLNEIRASIAADE